MHIRSILPGACCLGLVAATGIVHAAPVKSNSDKRFMALAARTDMTVAHEGLMAERQAKRPDVKNLADTLVHDQTDAYARLSALASKTGDSIPKGIDAAKVQAIQRLVHLKGDRFDRQFARDEIAAHRQAIAVFKNEAEHGSDAAVKAYASQMIPVLEKHIQLAESCLKPAKRT